MCDVTTDVATCALVDRTPDCLTLSLSAVMSGWSGLISSVRWPFIMAAREGSLNACAWLCVCVWVRGRGGRGENVGKHVSSGIVCVCVLYIKICFEWAWLGCVCVPCGWKSRPFTTAARDGQSAPTECAYSCIFVCVCAGEGVCVCVQGDGVMWGRGAVWQQQCSLCVCALHPEQWPIA